MLLVRLACIGWIGLSVLGASEHPAGSCGAPATLFFFFTPEAPGGPRAALLARRFLARHEKDVRIRPVLLAQDFRALRTLTEESPLYRTLKELESGSRPGSLDLPLYDEEGLELSERWDVRSVPAFVLVREGRAHRTIGSSPDLEHLWECKP